VVSDRDWDQALVAIDQQLASVSDEALVAAARPVVLPPVAPTPTGVMLRLLLAVGLGVAIVFWPYANRCGLGLAGYLAAVLAVAGAGWWTAVTTWRARAGRAHVVALALVAWGLILTAIEILPRVGYATDPARISWGCDL
jgi:hypothetical protein